MEGLDHRIHVGFGRHLAGARAFHFKSLSIGVIGGFNSLFQFQFQVCSGGNLNLETWNSSTAREDTRPTEVGLAS